MPFSVRCLWAMASRAARSPGVGAYLVCPASSARMAACLIGAGVSKSGSPTPKPTTSTPLALSAAALALTARVALSFMPEIALLTCIRPSVHPEASALPATLHAMHFDAHGPVLADLEARINAIRGSL